MPLTSQAQSLLTKFSQEPGVTPEQISNLQETIDSSPALINQINEAVSEGHVKMIIALPPSKHAGGEYDATSGAIRLALPMLGGMAGKSFNPAEVAFVLGHEVHHGFEQATVAKSYKNFHDEAKNEALEKSEIHDYTSIIAKPLSVNRNNEAAAEIAGWNAMLDHIKSANPNPSIMDIYKANTYRMKDFIDENLGSPTEQYTLKPNLTINADMTMSPTPDNIEAMGKNYFDRDKKFTNIGDLGKSDYATYYGVSLIEHAIYYENKHAKPYQGVMPQMTLNMAALGMSEKLLEEEGIHLHTPNKAPQPYYDSSLAPAILHHFDHTQDGPNNHQHVPIAPAYYGAQGIGMAPEQELRFFPRTLEDDYVDAFLDAAERGDYAGRRTLTQQYEQFPHVQALQQEAREAMLAEQQRMLEEQLRQEQERRRLMLQVQQEQEHSRSLGFSR